MLSAAAAMAASQAIELPSDPSSGEEGFRQVAGLQALPDTTQEQCCKSNCQSILTEDNPIVMARLVELKSAIDSMATMDKKKDMQFQMILAWHLASKVKQH